MIYKKGRRDLLEWLKKQLIGPASGENLLRGSPLDRYPTGILFPIMRDEEGIDPASVSDDDDIESLGDDTTAGSDAQPAKKRRRYMPPSSVGFSFFASGEEIRFQVVFSAACYKKTDARNQIGQFQNSHERSGIGSDEEAKTFTQPNQQPHAQSNLRVDVLGGRASIDVVWRPFLDGWIVTVSLFNKQESSATGDRKRLAQERIEQSLFEVNLRCFMEAGEIGTYPRVDKCLLSEEDQELELQYKHRKIFAIGHGVAVDWRVEQDHVKEILTEFMPAVEVPQVTADVAGDDNRVLGLAHLAEGETTTEIFKELDQFVEKYSAWVHAQNSQINKLEPDEGDAAKRITARMETALERMHRGVALLRSNPNAAESFKLANQAMLDQMRQADHVRGKTNEKSYNWRPFQLAFLLTVIESAICEDDDVAHRHFRNVVDLIWFPTGGGKTEAYLGLIAFLIVWRRLTSPATGGGTTVLMRYTLRLLTAQQYLRATRMICALELIRRDTPKLRDGPSITIGMWVGSATSPNRFEDAMKYVLQARSGNVGVLRSLVLENCPWCGTPFTASEGYIASETEFHFCCTNAACDFGRQDQGILPCNVVDEALYDEPPTLLIATIDKFARLAWDERANAFFGVDGNRAPELVIQDELHLIAGALGSVAGLYEAALDTVLTARGIRPKYIASTATIRMAEQQVKRLYGRSLAVFPPPGLSCDDSFFARTVPLDKRPGRMYVGYLAPMLDRQHCMAPLAAALLAAPEVIFEFGQEDRAELLDAWWTQVVYHGSLKGVGNSHNAFNIDVRDVVRRLNEERKQEAKEPITRLAARIAQLTSISSAEENANTFSRLEKLRDSPECLDTVLATNMVSVGLDVARLALMIVNGQPLTTAEYIQASSRVGRSEVPGLVFANYYRDQARSLSHYESFRPYHEAFYRFVEPTSVTPYTYQARTRALHAALVIAIRHAGHYLRANNQAGQFSPDHDYVKKVVEALKLRCKDADPQRAAETASHLDRLVEQWYAEAAHCQVSKIQLNYQAPDKDKAANRLLHNHDDQIKGLWPTLQSMRNVENTGLLKPL
ncbi:MAG: helicase-related protein [Candidatus Accumulibacter propinquus]